MLVIATCESNREGYAESNDAGNMAAGAETRQIEYSAQTQIVVRGVEDDEDEAVGGGGHGPVIHVVVSKNRRALRGKFWLHFDREGVVSDITGVTGMKIVRAILDGERTPSTLAEFRDVRCKASVETIGDALTGNYRDEHVFALRQALELHDFYSVKIEDCDREVERCLRALNEQREPPTVALPKARSKSRPKHEPDFEVRSALYTLVGGVDLTQIHGLGPYAALRIVAECGTDMSRWRTAKHFTSWLTLAPGNKISGGKVLSSRTRRSANRATALLRMAAVGVGRSSTALGAFFRRLAARVGKAKAVTATARKIAVIFYNTLRHGAAYVDPGVDYYALAAAVRSTSAAA
jgi:transposase